MIQESPTLLGYYALSPQLFSNSLFRELKSIGYKLEDLQKVFDCGKVRDYRLKKCGCKYVIEGKQADKKIIPFKYKCNNVKMCYNCSKVRQKELLEQYLPYLNSLKQGDFLRVRFLTISPEHYDNLEQAWIEAPKSLINFFRSDYGKKNILGGIWEIEVTEDGKGFHFHFHILVYGFYMQNKPEKNRDSELVRELKKFFKRNINVDIRLNNHKIKNLKISDRNKIYLSYMLTYISSFQSSFSNKKSYARYLKLSRKKKLISTFGCIFKSHPKKIKPNYVCKKCGEKIQYSNSYQEMEEFLKEFYPIKPFFSKSDYKPPDIIYFTEFRNNF